MKDKDAMWIIRKVIESFRSDESKGIPLGNVTSQLFANIYLNELDQFIKHNLKEKYYIRYCDDFIILGKNENHLLVLVELIKKFLENKLRLSLHKYKIIIKKHRQGIDFLGYVILPHHKVLRTKTKKRILKKVRENYADLKEGLISEKSYNQSLHSYLGVLKHCCGYKIENDIIEITKKQSSCQKVNSVVGLALHLKKVPSLPRLMKKGPRWA